MVDDASDSVKPKLVFRKLSESKLTEIDDKSRKEGVADKRRELGRREGRSSRFKEVGARKRLFRWSGIKDSLTRRRSEKLFFVEGESAEVSNVYEAIISRYNSYDDNIRETVDDAVFVLFDDNKATVEDVRNAADRVIDVCVKSDSVGVCSMLLEVNDIILFANEELGFVGETKVRRERRLQSYRIADRLLDRIRPRLLSFQR